jgi:hypothetical protein
MVGIVDGDVRALRPIVRMMLQAFIVRAILLLSSQIDVPDTVVTSCTIMEMADGRRSKLTLSSLSIIRLTSADSSSCKSAIPVPYM